MLEDEELKIKNNQEAQKIPLVDSDDDIQFLEVI